MSKRNREAHVSIDLDDVRAAGSVERALEAWCERSETTSCGVVGPSFSTSGPGSGWSVNHDENDYARRAVEEGALYYLDCDDGKLVSAEEVDEGEKDENGEWPDDVIHDLGGTHSRLSRWSEESVVEVICPSIEDAIQCPALVAQMAKSVASFHGAMSDKAAWRSLVQQIRDAAESLEDIDLDDLR